MVGTDGDEGGLLILRPVGCSWGGERCGKKSWNVEGWSAYDPTTLKGL